MLYNKFNICQVNFWLTKSKIRLIFMNDAQRTQANQGIHRKLRFRPFCFRICPGCVLQRSGSQKISGTVSGIQGKIAGLFAK